MSCRKREERSKPALKPEHTPIDLFYTEWDQTFVNIAQICRNYYKYFDYYKFVKIKLTYIRSDLHPQKKANGKYYSPPCSSNRYGFFSMTVPEGTNQQLGFGVGFALESKESSCVFLVLFLVQYDCLSIL